MLLHVSMEWVIQETFFIPHFWHGGAHQLVAVTPPGDVEVSLISSTGCDPQLPVQVMITTMEVAGSQPGCVRTLV